MAQLKISQQQAKAIARKYERGATLSELARHYGFSAWAVRASLKRQGVPLRKRGGRSIEWSVREVMKAKALYEAGASHQQIAAQMGVGPRTVARHLNDAGVKTRNPHAGGDQHGNWKGGRVSFSGYTAVLLGKDDPLYCMTGSTSYCMEHRLVMARALGRPLQAHETVHHINGDITDNRLANLQLRFGRHGKGVAMVCSDCGSRNIAYGALDDTCD